MSKVDSIKAKIEALPEQEYAELRQWFTERDWMMWDDEIYKDSDAGKLDFLVKEAKEDKEQGKLKDI